MAHVALQWSGERAENINQVGEMVTIWLTATLSGVFAGREKAVLRQVAAAYQGTVKALVAALDAREHNTKLHSVRVCEYTVRLARELGIGAKQQRTYTLAALLHDIGKLGIPDSILLKPGPLSDVEMQTVRGHPEMGRRILASSPLLREASEIVQAHHERFDGTGYPCGKVGDDIPRGARVFAVADVFDALTSFRPYRHRPSYEEARAEIEKGSGTQFDPQVVESFLRIPQHEWDEIRARVDHDRAYVGWALPPNKLRVPHGVSDRQ